MKSFRGGRGGGQPRPGTFGRGVRHNPAKMPEPRPSVITAVQKPVFCINCGLAIGLVNAGGSEQRAQLTSVIKAHQLSGCQASAQRKIEEVREKQEETQNMLSTYDRAASSIDQLQRRKADSQRFADQCERDLESEKGEFEKLREKYLKLGHTEKELDDLISDANRRE